MGPLGLGARPPPRNEALGHLLTAPSGKPWQLEADLALVQDLLRLLPQRRCPESRELRRWSLPLREGIVEAEEVFLVLLPLVLDSIGQLCPMPVLNAQKDAHVLLPALAAVPDVPRSL